MIIQICFVFFSLRIIEEFMGSFGNALKIFRNSSEDFCSDYSRNFLCVSWKNSQSVIAAFHLRIFHAMIAKILFSFFRRKYSSYFRRKPNFFFSINTYF